MSDAIHKWAAQIRGGDTRAVSRAITAIENGEGRAEELLALLFPNTGQAFVIGVTGAAGTGKSTLVDRLAAHYRSKGQTVGVLAVDPSSPFTGGAILGDRIRMQGHASDEGMFIRSMATRGLMGGLARATADAALILDAAGKQIVLIETVGVGQDEIEIARLADCTLVLVVPGLGDDVQNMKAGLLEAADIFVVNKGDRDGTDQVELQLQEAAHLAPAPFRAPTGPEGSAAAVIRTTALTGEGIPALAAAVEKFRAHSETSGAGGARRLAQWKRRLLSLLEEKILQRAVGEAGGERGLETLAQEVAERKRNPYEAVRQLLAAEPAARETRS
jgi:LAO/AO transport system kinase